MQGPFNGRFKPLHDEQWLFQTVVKILLFNANSSYKSVADPLATPRRAELGAKPPTPHYFGVPARSATPPRFDVWLHH